MWTGSTTPPGGGRHPGDVSEHGLEELYRGQRVQRRLVAIIAIVLTVFALEATATVTLPLAFALFLVALFWPLQWRLEVFLPRGIAAVITLLAFLMCAGGFVYALGAATDQVIDKAPEYQERFDQVRDSARSWAQRYGLPWPAAGDGSWTGALEPQAWKGARRFFDFLGAFVLVIGFLLLGLVEVRDYRDKIRRHFGREEPAGRAVHTIEAIAKEFQRYFVVRTVIGLITGALVAVFSLLIGLDFALIWGLLNFLLNYIPTLGSIVAVIPPVVFAALQFGDPLMVLLALGAVGGVQLVMGTWVDPLLQGRYLALSPLVVLLSVTLWGWMWGIAGAFISVPITIVVVLVCRRFDRTRWLADLLADTRNQRYKDRDRDRDDDGHRDRA
jgi:AI-2 transport protein TqsA